MKSICCLVDFTSTGKTAIGYASWLAKTNNATLNLIYFTARLTYEEDILRERIFSHADLDSLDSNITWKIVSGKYQKAVPKAVHANNPDLVVIGSHGADSFAEYWTAKNVLELAQVITIPVLVVNEYTLPAPVKLEKILFPLSPHKSFNIQVEEAARWAKETDALVNIFCLVKDQGDIPQAIASNIKQAEDYFKAANIAYDKTFEQTKVYSVGYAKDIIKYAKSNSFGLITIMSLNSEENMYFGDVEKTHLIQNDLGIPVLCANR